MLFEVQSVGALEAARSRDADVDSRVLQDHVKDGHELSTPSSMKPPPPSVVTGETPPPALFGEISVPTFDDVKAHALGRIRCLVVEVDLRRNPRTYSALEKLPQTVLIGVYEAVNVLDWSPKESKNMEELHQLVQMNGLKSRINIFEILILDAIGGDSEQPYHHFSWSSRLRHRKRPLRRPL